MGAGEPGSAIDSGAGAGPASGAEALALIAKLSGELPAATVRKIYAQTCRELIGAHPALSRFSKPAPARLEAPRPPSQE